MKVKYIGETRPMSLTNGNIYEISSVEKGWYRVKTDPPISDEVLYPPECFETIVSDWDDVDEVLFDGTPEQIIALRCPKCGGNLTYTYCHETRGMDINCCCGIQIRAHGASCVPNFAKATMQVTEAINLGDKGCVVIGEIRQGIFKRDDVIELLRKGSVIKQTTIGVEAFPRDFSNPSILLLGVSAGDIQKGDYIRKTSDESDNTGEA